MAGPNEIAREKDKIYWWQRFGTGAQIASACAAILALVAVTWQVSRIETNTRSASARQLYVAYMQSGLRSRFTDMTPAEYEVLKTKKIEYGRYKWYVGLFMFAHDEIFTIKGEEDNWIAAFKNDLQDHLAYLCEQTEPLYWNQHSSYIRSLIMTEVNRVKTLKPDNPEYVPQCLNAKIPEPAREPDMFTKWAASIGIGLIGLSILMGFYMPRPTRTCMMRILTGIGSLFAVTGTAVTLYAIWPS